MTAKKKPAKAKTETTITPRFDINFIVPAKPLPDATTSQFITSDQVDKIFPALVAAQGDVEDAIRTKTAKGDDGDYKYADLNDVMVAIRDSASKNKLGVIDRFPHGKDSLQSVLVHESGQWVDYGLYHLGTYTTHKEKQSAITYGRRIMRKAIFGVSDVDDDATAAGKVMPQTDAPAGEEAPQTVKPIGAKETPEEQKARYAAERKAAEIERAILPGGKIDFDAFAGEYEAKLDALDKDGNMSKLQTLTKANAKTLSLMEKERPDLFNNLEDKASKLAQKFL